MTHADAGHYKKKHPEGTPLSPEIADPLRQKTRDGCVTCAQAHDIAKTGKKPPRDVGMSMDLMELRLTACQLGLFGYGPKQKKVSPAATVSADLADAIEKKTRSGRISCESTWDIAEQLGIPKMAVAAACETLKFKISPCQLGAF
ncbi:MAG: hypothetical protein HKM93_02775 [Desulfobacteraceae bacterium]|nr:hypothetical protein [Desulfobacteraceae bacterium]